MEWTSLDSSWFTHREELVQHVWPSGWGQPWQNKPAPKQMYPRIPHSTYFLLSCVTAMSPFLSLFFPRREESNYIFHHSSSRLVTLSKRQILPPVCFKLFWPIQVRQRNKRHNLTPLDNLGSLRSPNAFLFIFKQSVLTAATVKKGFYWEEWELKHIMLPFWRANKNISSNPNLVLSLAFFLPFSPSNKMFECLKTY